MLKAKMSTGTLILGIDAENVRRLQDGKPIYINLEELGGASAIAILYGRTLEDVRREIEEAVGRPLPEPTPQTRQ